MLLVLMSLPPRQTALGGRVLPVYQTNDDCSVSSLVHGTKVAYVTVYWLSRRPLVAVSVESEISPDTTD